MRAFRRTRARVDVFDAGRIVASASTDERNHVWVEGLEPDHEYRYRITADGAEWPFGQLWDWRLGTADSGGLVTFCLMRRFEFVAGGSEKFWENDRAGTEVTVRFGRPTYWLPGVTA